MPIKQPSIVSRPTDQFSIVNSQLSILNYQFNRPQSYALFSIASRMALAS